MLDSDVTLKSAKYRPWKMAKFCAKIWSATEHTSALLGYCNWYPNRRAKGLRALHYARRRLWRKPSWSTYCLRCICFSSYTHCVSVYSVENRFDQIPTRLRPRAKRTLSSPHDHLNSHLLLCVRCCSVCTQLFTRRRRYIL